MTECVIVCTCLLVVLLAWLAGRGTRPKPQPPAPPQPAPAPAPARSSKTLEMLPHTEVHDAILWGRTTSGKSIYQVVSLDGFWLISNQENLGEDEIVANCNGGEHHGWRCSLKELGYEPDDSLAVPPSRPDEIMALDRTPEPNPEEIVDAASKVLASDELQRLRRAIAPHPESGWTVRLRDRLERVADRPSAIRLWYDTPEEDRAAEGLRLTGDGRRTKSKAVEQINPANGRVIRRFSTLNEAEEAGYRATGIHNSIRDNWQYKGSLWRVLDMEEAIRELNATKEKPRTFRPLPGDKPAIGPIRDILEVIRKARPASTFAQIATALNAQGLRTPTGLEWSTIGVYEVAVRHGIHSPKPHPGEKNPLHQLVLELDSQGKGVRKIAEELNSRGYTTSTGRAWNYNLAYNLLRRAQYDHGRTTLTTAPR